MPDPTITGEDISAKLQDIYSKSVLFSLHISKVDEYQRDVWDNPPSVADPLHKVINTHKNFDFNIKRALEAIDAPLPATPAPLQPSHESDYDKKEYGLGVIKSLREWLENVPKVLNVDECGNQQ